MRVFVTGGAGFIGSAFTRLLLAHGHEFVVYDNFRSGRREYLPDHGRVLCIEGDLRDRRRLEHAIVTTRPQHVVHLAALHFIPYCDAHPAETLEVNVDGTQTLLRACVGGSVESFVYASSAAVYAPSDAPCVEDRSALGPCDIYGESKLLGEQMLREYHEHTKIRATALRIFNAIGPRETNPHVVPQLFESLQKGDEIRLGNIASRRDYVNTFDVARAILAAFERGRGFQVFNVGCGVAHSVAEIVDMLRHGLRRPLKVMVDSSRLRPTDRPFLLANVRAIHETFGWLPQVSLATTLHELATFYGVSPREAESGRGQSSSS